MRKRLKSPADEKVLARILDALKQELIEASDEEIHETVVELGMNLQMKESAAFAGLTYPSRPQLSDFFEMEAFRTMRLEASENAGKEAVRPQHARTPRRSARTLPRRKPPRRRDPLNS